MSTLYLIGLSGVCLAVLALMLEAVVSVTRKPKWSLPTHRLQLVATEDRRTQELPFDGAERRNQQDAEAADTADVQRRAA